MRMSEWVAGGYFLYLLGVALAKRWWPGRRRALVASAAAALTVPLVSWIPDRYGMWLVRDWMPALYLIGGYWLSGVYFVSPMESVERWCLALDRWLLDDRGLRRTVRQAPRLVLELLECAYLSCPILVPAGALFVVLAAGRPAADRFWALVLVAELGSYSLLPWIQTRPPRDLEPEVPYGARAILIADLNRRVLRTASIQVNTQPSGHVAGALATALAVGTEVPLAGAMVLILAAAIAVGAVVGRYHYTIDALSGGALALCAWAAFKGFGVYQ